MFATIVFSKGNEKVFSKTSSSCAGHLRLGDLLLNIKRARSTFPEEVFNKSTFCREKCSFCSFLYLYDSLNYLENLSACRARSRDFTALNTRNEIKMRLTRLLFTQRMIHRSYDANLAIDNR